MTPINDQLSVPVECTAVPADPLWPEILRPGLPAPVDPEAPGVTDADLAAVIAARLRGCVTPTPSGWVKLACIAIGEQLVLTVTTWGPLSAGMPTRTVDRTVLLGESTAVSRDEPGARPDTAEC